MDQTNNTASQIIQDAEELLEEIKEGSEAIDREILQPIAEINALTDQVEADYDGVEGELIDLNDDYLAENDKDVAQIVANMDIILAEDEETADEE